MGCIGHLYEIYMGFIGHLYEIYMGFIWDFMTVHGIEKGWCHGFFHDLTINKQHPSVSIQFHAGELVIQHGLRMVIFHSYVQ